MNLLKNTEAWIPRVLVVGKQCFASQQVPRKLHHQQTPAVKQKRKTQWNANLCRLPVKSLACHIS